MNEREEIADELEKVAERAGREWGYWPLAMRAVKALRVPAASPLIAVIEDAIETLEAMDLHTDNPLYDRLVAAVTRPDRDGGSDV